MIEPFATRAAIALENATADQAAEGRAWFHRAHATARRLAHTYGVTEARAAAVLAGLSPRNRWEGNVTMAERLLADPTKRLIPAHEQARHARSWEDLSGPKVRAFGRAIATAGTEGEATIDFRMAELLGLDGRPEGARYHRAAEAVAQAAKLHGWPTHEAQSTLWVGHRNV